jgi:predicted RNA-binding Zn-ribbon protein involved in translation (DUF1610 family)
MKNEYIFACRKCDHTLYVSQAKLKGLEKFDCPNCGEEGYHLWIYKGTGSYMGKG